MQGGGHTLRRSSRLPLTLPILVTTPEQDANFSEVCETLVVSAHGCSMRSPVPLEAGIPVHLQSKEGRKAMAHVVDCQPMSSNQRGWKLAASLDRPENFWGLKSCPDDWVRLFQMPTSGEQRFLRKLTKVPKALSQSPEQVVSSLESAPHNSRARSSEDSLVSELIQPLQAEVSELREKLSRTESKRSSFEVSLSQIPPELEEQLWARLRQDLGEQVQRQTREASEQVFGAAKITIEQKIAEAQQEFRQRLVPELKAVENRALELSKGMAERVQQQFQAGEESLQQQLLDAGVSLEQRSDDFFRSLQQRLGEEHNAYRREVQQVQSAASSEWSRLQAQITDFDGRIGKLDEAARRLESDLDAHLALLASDIVFHARTQLESAVDVVLKELGTRNAKELGSQLDGACEQLRVTQKGIEASISELLRTRVAETLMSFGETMEELARDSVGRWRVALAKDLTSLVNILGEQFRSETASETKRGRQLSAD
jgi:hypothetical protein